MAMIGFTRMDSSSKKRLRSEREPLIWRLAAHSLSRVNGAFPPTRTCADAAIERSGGGVDPVIGCALDGGDLRVVDRLACTGFTSVYRARGGADWAAVKMMEKLAADDDELRARFAKEVEILRRLDGCGTPRTISNGQLNGRPWLATELVAGDLLAHRILAGAIDEDEAIRIALAILEALLPVHRRGVVHRDLKPSNVMLIEDHAVKLLDFGAAASERAESGALPLGTPAYAAPEQAACEPVDARVDLYAVGVMLFEMLCGRRPFLGDPVAVLNAHEFAEPPRPRSLCPSLSEAIETIVLRALAKDPARRWATAAAFHEALTTCRAERRHSARSTRSEANIK